MLKYKVKALYCGGNQNKIYKSGDVVDGSKFKDPEDLVKRGFLERVEETTAGTEAATGAPELTEEEKARLAQYLNSTDPQTDEPATSDAEPQTDEPATDAEPATSDAEPQTDEPAAGNQAEASAENAAATTKTIDDYTVADLKQALNDKGVAFEKKATKQQLYDLFLANQ